MESKVNFPKVGLGVSIAALLYAQTFIHPQSVAQSANQSSTIATGSSPPPILAASSATPLPSSPLKGFVGKWKGILKDSRHDKQFIEIEIVDSSSGIVGKSSDTMSAHTDLKCVYQLQLVKVEDARLIVSDGEPLESVSQCSRVTHELRHPGGDQNTVEVREWNRVKNNFILDDPEDVKYTLKLAK